MTEDEEANNDSVKHSVNKKILVSAGCWGLSGLFRPQFIFLISRGFFLVAAVVALPFSALQFAADGLEEKHALINFLDLPMPQILSSI